mgnify:CR=1 FL=1
MKLKDFIDKWEWKVIDYDGYYGYQCTDLVRQYCLEMFWETYKPHGNAWTLFNQDWGKDYIKYEYNSEFIPNEWDIVIFDWPTKYGHIAVVTEADLMSLFIIDQNTWSWNWDWKWDNKIRVHSHSYAGVIWYIRNINYNTFNMNKYTNILEDLAKDGYEPVFNDYEWDDWETKTLIEIWLARQEEKIKNKLKDFINSI